MLLAGGGGGRLLQPPSAQDPQMAEYGHRKWSKTVLPWRVPCPSGKVHTACSGGGGPILNCPDPPEPQFWPFVGRLGPFGAEMAMFGP
jgi:hypothetical protein